MFDLDLKKVLWDEEPVALEIDGVDVRNDAKQCWWCLMAAALAREISEDRQLKLRDAKEKSVLTNDRSG